MNNDKSGRRLPAILAIIGLVLLAGAAIYHFGFPRENAQNDTALTAEARVDAEKAMADAGISAKERGATEAIVRAYILDHPEIITEAIGILQQRDLANRLAAVGDVLHAPFPGAEAGNPRGDVTIVEFTDYNCGFCRQSVADVEKLIAADKNIRIIYREVPILAESSRDAALWALAAAKQGRHKEFHSAMFSGARPNETSIRQAAVKAGMNLAMAQSFIASAEAKQELQKNLTLMQQLGFNGTPTFIIGDQALEGALGHDALKDAVARARASS